MPPLRFLLACLVGALLGARKNKREWRKAEDSLAQAATLWGERLKEQDKRSDEMSRLAERQVQLGWIGLGIAVLSVGVAVVALVQSGSDAVAPPVMSGTTAPGPADLGFYESAAQLFPVLLIAVFIEGRFVQPPSQALPPVGQLRDLVQFFALLFPFVFGEIVALDVLADGTPGDGDRDTVTASLAVCTVFLLVPVTLAYARKVGRLAVTVVEFVLYTGVLIAAAVGFGLI